MSAEVVHLRLHRSRSEEAKRDELVRAAIRLATKFSEYRRLGHQTMSVGAVEATELIDAAKELLS